MLATIKAFGPGMTGRNNKKYHPYVWNVHNGEVNCDNSKKHSGFFSVEDPLDVLSYYKPDFDNQECWLCLIDGEIDKGSGDSKVAAQYLYPVIPLTLLQFAACAGKYIKEHPWVKHAIVHKESFTEKAHERNENFVIVRGKHPQATAQKGMVVVLLKEHQNNETITNMAVYQVDDTHYHSGTAYMI